MQKFLLSSFGVFSFLLIGAAVCLGVLNSRQQIDAQGRALGATIDVIDTPTSVPSIAVIPTEPPMTNQSAVLAQAEGLQNPTLTRKTVTIFKRKDLQELWATVYGSQAAAPPLPVIDFKKNAVIAVLAGKQPATQYKVTYTGVDEDEEYSLVKFDETVPGAECRTTDGMVSPFIIVQVPNTGKTFKTVFNTSEAACSQ